jgi:conjugative transfer pilus assembly protein TraH
MRNDKSTACSYILIHYYLVTLIVFFILITTNKACANSIDHDLDQYFNDLGYSSNTTSPNVYHGQQAGYYTGGSVSLRNQVRDVQVVQYTLPSYRSGCGGIDLFAGSFSMITSDEMTALLQNILNSAGAYAFTLALESTTPEIENVMNKWNEYLSKINQANLNSCEMAENLVGGMWPKMRNSQQRVCEDVGSNTGVFSDWAKARQGCGVGGDFNESMKKGMNDSRYQEMMFNQGNIVWMALQKNKLLRDDTQLAELFMSLSGTVILDNNGNGDNPTTHKSYPALVENNNLVKALLDGGNATIYHCNDTTQTRSDLKVSQVCLKLEPYQTITVSENNGFKKHVAKLLNSIAEKIRGNEALSQEEIGLLQATSLPVYKMLTVQTAYMKDGKLPDVNQYSDVIAIDIVYQYLHESLSIIKASVAITPFPDEIIAEIEPSIDRELEMLAHQRTTAYSQLAVTTQLIEQTQDMERMLAGSLSTDFASTLSWAKGLR